MLKAVMLLLWQGNARSWLAAPGEGAIESTVVNAVQWVRLVVETTGAAIIGLGVVVAAYQLLRVLIPPRMEGYNAIRLTLARYLALALEFQLGADILSTAIAPSWNQIGKLGAIAAIRTGINYFLTREMRAERQEEGEVKKAKVESVKEPAV